jgi:lysophospholipase L1-like esterase
VGAVSEAQVSLIERNSIANGVDLRILPLGDSITWGFQSSTGDGYRQALLDLLPNNDVLYIGSQHSGSMDNNADEGWPGWHIQWLESKAELSLPEQPNVVLLMAGTNDMIYNDSIADAPARLGNLMDVCIAACPDAVLVVATLTPLHNPLGDTTGENKTLVYNAALPAVVKQRADAGSKVLLVDMQNPVDGLTIDELADGIHPDDEGYTKMADVWLDGLNNASSRGWITAPVDLAANSTSVNVTSSTAASSSVASPSIVSTATAASAQAKSSASATIVSTSSASINLPHLELRSVFVVVSTVLVSSCTLLC